jgi:hypothetical protein
MLFYNVLRMQYGQFCPYEIKIKSGQPARRQRRSFNAIAIIRGFN